MRIVAGPVVASPAAVTTTVAATAVVAAPMSTLPITDPPRIAFRRGRPPFPAPSVTRRSGRRESSASTSSPDEPDQGAKRPPSRRTQRFLQRLPGSVVDARPVPDEDPLGVDPAEPLRRRQA